MRYDYITNVIEDLMEFVLEYAIEVEHMNSEGFTEETSKTDLLADFVEYMKHRNE